jgi:hypothetical protein
VESERDAGNRGKLVEHVNALDLDVAAAQARERPGFLEHQLQSVREQLERVAVGVT